MIGDRVYGVRVYGYGNTDMIVFIVLAAINLALTAGMICVIRRIKQRMVSNASVLCSRCLGEAIDIY